MFTFIKIYDRITQLLKDWVKLNKDLIVKYWNKEIDDQELLNKIENYKGS